MKKIDLINHITSSQQQEHTDLLEEIKALQKKKERSQENYEVLRDRLGRVYEALKKEQLDLVNVEYKFSHDRWAVKLTVQPVGEKHQFVSGKGRDSSGEDKNKEELYHKALLLNEAIEQHCGVVVDTNPYSFRGGEEFVEYLFIDLRI